MNKMEKKLVPKLRFPEFATYEPWKESTLGQLARFRRGSFPQPYGLPEWYDSSGLPFIQVYDVDDNFRLKQKTKSRISKLGAKQSVFIPEGTIIITIQGSIGRVAITQYDAYIDRTLLLFESFNEPIDKTFFAYVLFLLFEIEKLKAPGGIIKTITKEVLSDFKLKVPSLFEQQKIANCLSSLDDLLTAENEKLDALKNHKKGLMQQLFPADGEKVPKFRFPEFKDSGEWLEKELDKICQVNPSNSKLPNQFIYIDLESVNNGNLGKKRMISLDGAPSRAQRLLANKDVIFQTVRPYQKNNYYFIEDKINDYVASTGYAQLRAFQSSDYLFQLIHTDKFVNDVLAKCTGSNYPAINSSHLAKIFVQVPPTDVEQQRIADCLSSLNDQISAQTQKINELKLHKKGLMQQLFPTIN